MRLPAKNRSLAGLPLLAVAALALFMLVPAPAVAADKDCANFSNQRAAQFFFLRHGGPRYDPDRLDADNDGIACEDNPCPCYFKKHLPQRRPAREQAVRPLDFLASQPSRAERQTTGADF